MKPGKYYVGDLCYVMDRDTWDEMHCLSFPSSDSRSWRQGRFLLQDGREYYKLNTAHGDGTFISNWSDVINVDTGSIGCIAADQVDLSDQLRCGAVCDFKTEFFPYRIGNGLIGEKYHGLLRFGDGLEIDTSKEARYFEIMQALRETRVRTSL